MNWFGRFLLWGTLLAYPCYLLAGPLQQLLIAMVSLALGLGVRASPAVSTDLAASNMLGIYAAMCLASTHAPRATRWRALAAGVGLLVAIEWFTGLVSVMAALRHADLAAGATAWQRLAAVLLSNPRVIGVPALWLLLLGRWELPLARGLQPQGRRPRAPAGPAKR